MHSYSNRSLYKVSPSNLRLETGEWQFERLFGGMELDAQSDS